MKSNKNETPTLPTKYNVHLRERFAYATKDTFMERSLAHGSLAALYRPVTPPLDHTDPIGYVG